MAFFDLYNEKSMKGIDSSLNKLDFYFHHDRTGIIDIDFHLHDGFEIYFLISGDVNYFIENKIYELKPGDLVITNNYEIHTPSFISEKSYERVCIEFGTTLPALVYDYCPGILDCFIKREKGERNRIKLNKAQKEELLSIFSHLDMICQNEDDFSNVIKITYLLQILVLLNKAFLATPLLVENSSFSPKITSIIEYIEENLNEDLTLEVFEKNFYINGSYLSRIFKKTTGVKLHEYILHKRIAKSKEYLSNNYSVTETCYLTGFKDYSNFLRMFKRIVGVTPGQYMRLY